MTPELHSMIDQAKQTQERNADALVDRRWREVDAKGASAARMKALHPSERSVPHWDFGGYAKIVFDKVPFAQDKRAERLEVDHVLYWYQTHPQSGVTRYWLPVA